MKVVPVTRYPDPSYPIRELLEADPELLRACPNRWKENALLVGMLTAAPALVWAEDPGPAGGPEASLVAPLFKHGKGNTRAVHGTTFSIVPVLLSEDDARQVIEEQFAETGLDMSNGKKPTHEIKLVVTDPRTKRQSEKATSITMDGSDAKHGVAYEYLSAADGKALGGSDIGLAERVRAALAKRGPAGAHAVFYDPAPTIWQGMRGPGSGDPIPGMKPCKLLQDTTLMPLGLFRGQNFGLSTRVVVDGKKVTVTNGPKRLVMSVGAQEATRDGRAVKLPAPAVERDGVVYAPVRTVAESLGLKVTWDPKAGRVTLAGPMYVGRLAPDGSATENRFVEQQRASAVLKPVGAAEAGQTFAFVGYDREAHQALTKAESKRLLRLQVHDFVAWLKANGVI